MQVDKPFSRGVPFLKEDVDLMIDCFLANFRINPHNNDTLKVGQIAIHEVNMDYAVAVFGSGTYSVPYPLSTVIF